MNKKTIVYDYSARDGFKVIVVAEKRGWLEGPKYTATIDGEEILMFDNTNYPGLDWPPSKHIMNSMAYEASLIKKGSKPKQDKYLSKKTANELLKVASLLESSEEKLIDYIDKKYPGELHPVAVAYAEYVNNKPSMDEEAYSLRNLQFDGKYTSDANIFVKQAHIVKAYGRFTEGRAQAITMMLADYKPEYRLGREYSVVLYIKSDNNANIDLKQLKKVSRADECSLEPTGEIRLWWD